MVCQCGVVALDVRNHLLTASLGLQAREVLVLGLRHVLVGRYPIPQPTPRGPSWATRGCVRRQPLLHDRLHRAAANQQLRGGGAKAQGLGRMGARPRAVCAGLRLVQPRRVQEPPCRGGEAEGARARPHAPTAARVPRGHVRQQPVCHAVQEGRVRAGCTHSPHRYQV